MVHAIEQPLGEIQQTIRTHSVRRRELGTGLLKCFYKLNTFSTASQTPMRLVNTGLFQQS